MLFSLFLLAAIVWPAGTQIIEREPVPSAKGPRELVLWMVKPIPYPHSEDYCGTDIHGDYWEGQARLSLLDPRDNRIINTVTLPPELLVPRLVNDTVWHIPAGKKGKPKILHLEDLTGEGKPAQFRIFSYGSCGITHTGVAGYSAKLDRAILYSTLTHNDKSPWISQVFRQQPVRPGRWDFVWTPSHGSIDYFRERIDFDPVRQVFARDPELIPAPSLPTYLPPGGRIIEQEAIDARRALVLWMQKPRYANIPREYHAASEFLYNPWWIGPAYLSLLDITTNRIVQSIDLPKDLPIPAAGYYSYPGSKQRRPVLEMRDLTGEGVKGQFSLLEYLNSSTNVTRAYGYSPTQDRLVQYKILDGGKPQLSIPVIFQQPQASPGLWKFIHSGDHGDDAIYDEHVTFDRTRQLFVREVKITKQKNP